MPTRGTTAANRLRRSDRWLTGSAVVRAALSSQPAPVAVDLGYGRLPVTTVELASRLRAVAPDVVVVGLEIDPERVAAARALSRGAKLGTESGTELSTASGTELSTASSTELSTEPGVEFRLGGFELAGLTPVLVRAFNVLRQYPEEAVAEAWDTMRARLAPSGVIIDGTCDELGRRSCWVLLDRGGPVSLTLACDPRHIDRPSDLAERLPKALIHHNVPGRPVHELLVAADRAWAAAAAQSVFGPRARWQAMLAGLRDRGIELEVPRRSSRDAVLTVPWRTVAPP